MIASRNNTHALLLLLAGSASVLPSVRGFTTGTGTTTNAKQPPMPFKWPVVGTLPDFLARGGVDRLREIYEDMYDEFGEIYGMSIMGVDELIICDPNVYDSVLRKEGRYPIGAAEMVTTFTDYYAENNLTFAMKGNTHGPVWKEWRSGFEADLYVQWASYIPVIADTASKISNVAGYEVYEQKNIAFVDFLSRSAFDMFSAVMYGESPQTTDSKMVDTEDVEFVDATQKAFELTGALMLNPMEKVFGSDIYQQFKVNFEKTFYFGYKRTQDKLEQASRFEEEQKVEDGEESPAKCPIQSLKNGVQTNFLNPSLVERLVNRGQLSDGEMSEMTAPMLMAGVDTTGYVMSWFFLNLASNPNAQTKLASELKTVLNGADITTVDQIESLPYLKACMRESYRLTPTASGSIKTLEQDIDVVVNDATYHVPAGQRITLNLRAFPMDPKYVEKPNLYLPDRFLPDAIKARKGTLSEVIDHPAFADPFGRGKRRCIGANVAVAEMTILAARMFQDWEITLVDPSDENNWKPKQKLMLKADPYPAMKLVHRRTADVKALNEEGVAMASSTPLAA